MVPRLLFAACVLGVGMGCRATPGSNGEPITGNCAQVECPSGLRCIDGACLNNTVPTVGPFDLLTLVYGSDIDVQLTAADWLDADDTALTFTWTQVDNGAQALLAEPVAADRLLISKPPRGDYLFEVVADDGFDRSAPATLSVSVTNNPPMVTPSYLEHRLVGETITIDAAAADVDPGHSVEVIWETVVAPASATPVIADDQLTITLAEAGLYSFAATPRDFLTDSAPTEYVDRGETGVYRIVVEEEAGITYVNGGFRPEPGVPLGPCGDFTQPCLTVTEGITQAASRSGLVHVAALPTTVAYDECLDLGGDERVVGGFDPESWESPAPTTPADRERRDRLRVRTEIRCSDAAGHRVTGNGSLQDLTLTSSVSAAPAAYTLQVTGPGIAPTFLDIDVIGAACGDECNGVGISSSYADARFFGVDVTAPEVGLRILASFAGYQLNGGKPILSAAPFDPLNPPSVPAATRTSGDGLRGTITLAAPVTSRASGVYLLRSDAILRRLHVRGGLGAALVAVSVTGGAPTIELSLLEVFAIGTQQLAGISVVDCGTDPACACSLMPQGLCNDPTVVGASGAAVRAARNHIVLTGGDSGGQVPCGGFGIAVQTAQAGNTVANNVIELERRFHLGIGLAVVGGGGGGGGVDQVLDNQVAVDGGKTEWACFLAGGVAADSDLAGAYGAAVFGAAVEFSGQTLEVGAHDWSSAGLLVGEASGLRIEGNMILGAADRGPVDAAGTGIGAILVTADASVDPSVFINNTVQMANGAVASVGVLVDASHWIVANNLIYGGTANYTVGLLLNTAAPDAAWPQIVHNTIHGGGDPATTLGSRAVMIDSHGGALIPAGSNSGILRNNLLDAGDAGGRRYLIDRIDTGDVAGAAGNVSQFVGQGTGLRPVLAVASRKRVTGEMTADLILAGAGEMISVRQGLLGLAESRGVATQGPVNVAWAGFVARDDDDWTVVGRTGSLAVALGRGAGGKFAPVSTKALVGGRPVALDPASVVAGEYDGEYPTDLVFVTRAATQSGPGVWLLPGRVGGGFGVPTRISDAPVEDPLLIAVPSGAANAIDGSTGGIDTFFVVDREFDATGAQDGLSLHVLPGGPVFDLAGSGIGDVSRLVVGDLGIDMSGSPCNSSGVPRLSHDLVITGAGELRIYLQPCMEPDGSLVSLPYASATTACNGAAEHVALSNSETTYSPSLLDLWVGCADGSIEVWVLDPVPPPPQLLRLATEPAAVAGTIGAFTASAAIPNAIGGFVDAGDLFVASELDRGPGVAPETRVQVIEIIETAPFVFAIQEVASTSLLDQVATRNFVFTPQDQFVLPNRPRDPVLTPCDLVGPTGGGVYDLHLDASGNVASCRDAGDPLSGGEETIGLGFDIDGDGRDTPTLQSVPPNPPDAGADELP